MDQSSYPLYVDYLNRQGKLDYFMYGILLSTDISAQSEITFGAYDSSAFNVSGQLYAHSVAGSFHWSLNLVSFSYNGT